MGLKIRLPLDLQKIAATPIVTPWRMALHWENLSSTTPSLTPRPPNRPLKIAKLTPCKKPEVAGSAGHCEPGVGRFTDPHPFTCSFFTPSFFCSMFGLCALPSAFSKPVLSAKKDSLFHRVHPGLQCAAIAGSPGPAFSFSACPLPVSLTSPSYGKTFFLSPRFASAPGFGHNCPTRLQRGGEPASLVVLLPGSQNRTQGHTGASLVLTVFSWGALGLVALPSPAPACNLPPPGWGRW